MTTAEHALATDQASAAMASFAPYAQLAKMLVPSSGCIAVYDPEAELIWCSDGYERPDLRELVEDIKHKGGDPAGAVRKTSSDVTAFASSLHDDQGLLLGFVTVEFGAERASSNQMAASLLRPVLACLASRMSLERQASGEPERRPAPDLDFLIGVNEVDTVGADALLALLNHCVQNLGCDTAAFQLPDQNIRIVTHKTAEMSDDHRQFLEQTQKHLLAWAQLNNKPMVVNRVSEQAGPNQFKILSCPVRDGSQQVMGLMALFRSPVAPDFELRDVHILEFLSRKAVSIVNEQHDRMTGLLNRFAFEQRLQSALDQRGGNQTGAVLYLDIDRLQSINDAFGLSAGDELIHRLAELILGAIGDGDIACRLAGDRFAIFLEQRIESHAAETAESLRRAMAQLGYMHVGNNVPVSISIGLVEQHAGVSDARHMLALAELACKQARAEGGNRRQFFLPSDTVSPRRERELIAVASLQRALKGNHLRLLAQPIVDAGDCSGAPAGYEILVRMRDDAGSLLAPGEFLDAARRYRLTPAVDQWVFTSQLRELGSFDGSLANLSVGICVNVSEQSLASRDYRAAILSALDDSDLPAELFCFEFSESTAISRAADAEAFINTVRAAGCRTALDNFGRGLTSISHLRRLSVDFLKIDGRLIRGMREDRYQSSMVLGLVSAAQSLNIRIVAEHVEDPSLVEQLQKLGFDYLQGFAFGQPKPLLRLLAEGSNSSAPLIASQS